MEKIRLNMNAEKIFNNGYIELIDSMGNDLTVSNAARCSFDNYKTEFDDKDKKLIYYLAKNKHWAPFRHPQFQFLMKLPEIVTRQFYKHVVGIAYSEERTVDHAWSEVSQRYVEAHKLGFWIPDELRQQSKSNKQGSTSFEEGAAPNHLIEEMIDHNQKSIDLFQKLIQNGVCKEQARSILTTSFNTKFVWTCSLQALFNFLVLRDHPHAQKEIQEVAKVIKKLAYPICPISLDALFEAHDLHQNFKETVLSKHEDSPS